MSNVSLITIIYAIVAICSIATLFIYVALFKNKINKNGLGVFIAIVITNVGYFLLSCSKTLPSALMANRLAYLGSILLIDELFFVINEFCNIKVDKRIKYVLFVISIFIFVLTMSAGTSIKLYYSDVEISIVDNLTTLVKQYGKLHGAYLTFVIIIYVSMIASIIYAFVYKKLKLGVNPPVLAMLVGENIFIWIIEKYLNPN